MNSIWFVLNTGSRTVDEDMSICETPKHSRKMILTPAHEFTTIKDTYRAELHRQLNDAIDEINARINFHATPES
jgi:hypothetical protein